jgi:5-methyltetrahydrofolate--homocysteine methyltransferase
MKFLRKIHFFLSRLSLYPLILSSGLAGIFFAGRVIYAHNSNYINLLWNLLLAWVPYIFSFLAATLYRFFPKSWWLIPLPALVWLVFFPNAPYMVTDFYHLALRPPVPFWYDIGLIAIFAFAGCFLAIASLRTMHQLVDIFLGKFIGWVFALIVLGLGGLGVYVGRFGRWNSWDLLFHPKSIIKDIGSQLLNPLDNLGFIGFTLMFTAIMTVFYLMFVSVNQLEPSSHLKNDIRDVLKPATVPTPISENHPATLIIVNDEVTMNKRSFLECIKAGNKLVADGATGTNLLARGLPQGSTAENWVLDQPDQITRLHQDFLSAGADILLTNTFGASSLRLAGSGLVDQLIEINQRAVELARKVAQENNGWVAASLGPVGALLKPYGPLEPLAVTACYAEQARILSAAGVDLLVIETQFDLGEAKAAIQGVRSVTTLPLICSFSFDRGRRTMMGVSPTQATCQLNDFGIDLIGINCGRSLEENLLNLQELREATNLPIWFKPNAGLPLINGQGHTTYNVSPAEMGFLVPSWLSAGAQVIGGCCGTSPEHLAKIAQAVKTRQ